MNVITQKPHLMLIQLVAFCASFSVSLASPEAYEYPGALHAIGDGSTLYGEIELQGFDAIEDPKGIHAGAPFSLCQLDADPYPEILVKSYNSGQPGKRGVKLYAYDHDGVQLWMREMGGENRNYGAWSPVIACDLDQDGLDEIYAYNWEKGGLCELIQINILDGTTSRQTSWPGAEAMAPGVMPWRGALMIAQLSPGVPSLVAITGYQGDAGHEIVAPHKNVGRTIMISIAVCIVVYLLVAVAVGSSLSISDIVVARDYSLAAAARPALGELGFYFTVAIAIAATTSGVIASVFAVSRMLTMLTDMKMIPHSHFGMSGGIRSHMLVYTVVVAGTLAVLFDLSRIASLGAFFYLVMDMLVHWGVFRHLREEVGARASILLAALAADGVVLVAFTVAKLRSDPAVVIYAVIGIAAVFVGEWIFLSRKSGASASPDSNQSGKAG